MKASLNLIIADNGSLTKIVPVLAQDVLDDAASVVDCYRNIVSVESVVALAVLVAGADKRGVTIVEYINSLQEAKEKSEKTELKTELQKINQ
jgi:Ni,Fe-hydrogenase III small subunit